MNGTLSTQEAAARLGVSVDTLRQWERSGRLRAERTAGNHRRFLAVDVDRLRAELAHRGQGGPSAAADSSHSVTTQPLASRASHLQERVREARATSEVLQLNRVIHEQIASRDEERARSERELADAQQNERHAAALRTLREFGWSLAGQKLPVEWCAEVVADLEAYVTPERFPFTLPADQARGFVEARVMQTVKRYEERLQQLRARREHEAKQAQERTQVAALHHAGKQSAQMRTVFWSAAERARALHEVEDRLQEEVGPTWTHQEVDALVVEVLGEMEQAEDELEDDDFDQEEEFDEED